LKVLLFASDFSCALFGLSYIKTLFSPKADVSLVISDQCIFYSSEKTEQVAYSDEFKALFSSIIFLDYSWKYFFWLLFNKRKLLSDIDCNVDLIFVPRLIYDSTSSIVCSLIEIPIFVYGDGLGFLGKIGENHAKPASALVLRSIRHYLTWKLKNRVFVSALLPKISTDCEFSKKLYTRIIDVNHTTFSLIFKDLASHFTNFVTSRVFPISKPLVLLNLCGFHDSFHSINEIELLVEYFYEKMKTAENFFFLVKPHPRYSDIKKLEDQLNNIYHDSDIHIIDSSLVSIPSEVLFFILQPKFFLAFNSTSIASVKLMKIAIDEVDDHTPHIQIPSPNEAEDLSLIYRLPKASLSDNFFVNKILESLN